MIRILAVVVALAGVAHAQPRPPGLAGVGLAPTIGAQLPLDLTFSDIAGRRVELRELFDGGRPVVLVLAYVRCKMLCSVVLRGAIEALRAMPQGTDYRFAIASIDPHEDAASAAAKASELRARVGDVTYLLGAERPTKALADSLGFHYAWDPRSEQYAHPAAIFVLTPDGRLSRVLEGVQFDPAVLAGALAVAADGKLDRGSAIATDVLACFRFDPAARAHRELIERFLQIAAVGLALLLISTIVGLIVWERRRAA